MELTLQQKVFKDLWDSGHRFLTDEEMKNMSNGAYKEIMGKVDGYTIEGLKGLALRGGFKMDDGSKITEEEVEMMFSYLKFMRQFK